MTWAIATTGPERKLSLVLADHGFETYCPVAKVKIRPNGKRRPVDHVIKAAFLRYFFIKYDQIIPAMSAAWGLGGWFDVLKAGDEWSKLSEAIVEGYRADEAAGKMDQTYRIFNNHCSVGDWVRVIQKDHHVAANAFAGMEGYITKVTKYHGFVDGPEWKQGEVRVPNTSLLKVNRNQV